MWSAADSDGQHRVDDILRVAERLPAASDMMVLGTRSFSGNVPARSKLGNTATRWLFRLATGESIPDTQTGLRGYPAGMLTAAFLVLTAVTGSVLFAVVGARGISSAVNFLINRHLVFRHGRERTATRTGVRYFALVLTLLAANLALMSALDLIAVAALPAKLLAEAALLAVSYSVQQRFLFARKGRAGVRPAPGRNPDRTAAVPATHIPAMVPAQFPHSLSGNRRDQSTH